MKIARRLLLTTVFTLFAAFFASTSFAMSQTFSIAFNGNPSASTPDTRRTALTNYLGAQNLMPTLASGDTIIVNWTGGTTGVWRSTWSVTFFGSALQLNETSAPEPAKLQYSYADQQRFCQSSIEFTLNGYVENWTVVMNGSVSSGSDFVSTGYSETGTSLCYQNV